jgi:hypothetical protein
LQQPDYVVFECITEMESLRMAQSNIDSRVHAIGWAGLFNGFKGKEDPSIDYTELLPFPNQAHNPKCKLSDVTKAIINEAIRKKDLPLISLTSLALLLN